MEQPGLGDPTRAWGPPYVGSETAYFMSVNRNKQSVAVDLKVHEVVDVPNWVVGAWLPKAVVRR